MARVDAKIDQLSRPMLGVQRDRSSGLESSGGGFV